MNKVAYVLSKYADSTQDLGIDDDSGFIALGSTMFNYPMTADEL